MVFDTMVCGECIGTLLWERQVSSSVYAPVFLLNSALCMIAGKNCRMSLILAATGKVIDTFTLGQSGDSLNAIGDQLPHCSQSNLAMPESEITMMLLSMSLTFAGFPPL